MKVLRDYSGRYEEYLNLQKEKSLDPVRVKKWLNEEWGIKVDMFETLFKQHTEYLGVEKALCICARTGQEVQALMNMGVDAIGIDIVDHPPLVIKGDAHDLDFENDSFTFVFTNSLDHSPYPKKFISEMIRVIKKGGHGLLHLQITDNVDEYTENILLDPSPVLDELEGCKIVKSHSIVRDKSSIYQWEILFEKL